MNTIDHQHVDLSRHLSPFANASVSSNILQTIVDNHQARASP